MSAFFGEFADYFLSILIAYGFWFGLLAVLTWRHRKIYPLGRLQSLIIALSPIILLALVGASSRVVVGYRSWFDYLSRLNYYASGIGQTLLLVFVPMLILTWMFAIIMSGRLRIWSTINRLVMELVGWSLLMYVALAIGLTLLQQQG